MSLVTFWKRYRKVHVGAEGVAMLGLACLFLVASGGLTFILCLWRAYATARSAPTRLPAGARVIILGGGLENGGPSSDFAARLQRGRDITGDSRVILLGGVVRPGLRAESHVGRDWLVARGVDEDRIVVESRSRDTLENLRAVREFIAGCGHGPVVLVTSRYHLARASIMATGLGLAHIRCAAENRLNVTPRTMWRMAVEAFLINWYVVGRGWGRLIRSERILARIT